MASSGKDRPNLKICIDNVEESSDVGMSDVEEEDVIVNTNIDDNSFDDEEEGDSSVDVKIEERPVSGLRDQRVKDKEDSKVCEDKGDNLATGLDVTSKEYVKKKKDRAKRFGIKREAPSMADKELQKLYESLGVTQAFIGADRSERGVRLDAIHVRGVDNMCTADVFHYFQDFGPEVVEWIDDMSCNVVWPDTISAARAMKALTFDPSRETTAKIYLDGDKEKKAESESTPGDDGSMETDTNRVTAKDSSESDNDDDHLDLMADVTECAKPAKADKEEEKDKEEEEQEEGELEEQGQSEEDADRPQQQKNERMSEDSQDNGDVKRQAVTSDKWMKKKTMPPGKWRCGTPCAKADTLFLRFATKADKKIPGAEKRSKYYQKHGNSNYEGVKGIISGTRKRRLREVQMQQDEEEEEARTDDDDSPQDSVGLVTRPQHVSAVSVGHIPDETLFDLHTKDAQTQRLKTARLQKRMQWSEDEEELSDRDAELHQDEVAPPPAKRSMRMYADDIEDELRSKRSRPASSGTLAMDSSPPRQRSVHSRLQLGTRQNRTERVDHRPRETWKEELWQRPRQQRESVRDQETVRDSGARIRSDIWQQDEELDIQQYQNTVAKRNGIWNRNPDWDQNRYKDLDAPPEEADGGWNFPSHKSDFVTFTTASADNDFNKNSGNEEEEDEDEDDGDFGSRGRGKDRRWQWRTETTDSRSTGDLRKKLDSRRRDKW